MPTINEIITSQIEANKAGLKWATTYQEGQDKIKIRKSLIANRVELKHIKYALNMHPAAAVFGESQVGKSYLVDNLLASEKGPLNIYDGKGEAYSFIDQINPLGKGKEATSLVSRFTTEKQWINDDYPIRAVLLSPIDMVLTLCDTYFNDVQDNNLPSQEQVRQFIVDTKQRFSGRPVMQSYITEDEMFEMKQYFEMGVLNRGELFIHILQEEKFFDEMSTIISSVEVGEWIDVFKILWNNNEIISETFSKLIACYRTLHFKNEVYIQIDAVLRKNGTLLHVDRLFELFGVNEYSEGDKKIEVECAKVKDMSVWVGDRSVTVEKSVFCALTAELILYVGEDLKKEKPFLSNLDLLDFPGARSRIMTTIPFKRDVACQLLIRGKVAYLFNKYSNQYLISNLLFCHHREKSEVVTLSGLLDGWIKGMIGKDAAERTRYMQNSKVPPLFLIATKFNVDLQKDDIDISSDEEARRENLSGRWNTRFNTLSNLIGNQVDWFNGWIAPNGNVEPFKNTYLLRSYNFSYLSGVYTGFKRKDEKGIPTLIKYVKGEDANGNPAWVEDADGKVIGDTAYSDDYREFIGDIKKTFLSNQFVKSHFQDPETSWKKAVEPGCDGSAWIIENLTVSSRDVMKLREKVFNDKINILFDNLCVTLCEYFHDDDSDARLKEALDDAGRITLLLDGLFGKDKYFFAEFISRMLVHEDKLNDKILNTIKSNSVIVETDLSQLFAIRNNAGIDPNISTDPDVVMEENRRRIREVYHFDTDAALDAFLAEMKVTMNQIINPPKVRNLPRLIIEDVEKFWLDSYLDPGRFEDFIERGMPEKYIGILFNRMKILYGKELEMTDMMTDRIKKYVVNLGSLDDMAEMLADICAEMINRFVNTMGTAYFQESNWNRVESIVQYNNFDIKVDPTAHDRVEVDDTSVRKNINQVFDVFDNVDQILNQSPVDTERLSYFSNYHAYREWTDMMKIAFLATCNRPSYKIEANNALREILLTYILNNEALQSKLTDAHYEKYHIKSLRALDNSDN